MTDNRNKQRRLKRWLTIAFVALLAIAGCTAANSETSSDKHDSAAGSDNQQASKRQDKPTQHTPDAANKITSISLGMDKLALAPGEAYALQPDWTPAELANTDSFSYASSDTRVATVDDSGLVTISSHAVTGDQAVITVEAGQAQASLTLTVKTKLSETAHPGDDGFLVVTNPTSYDVVVNKERRLPDGFYPDDLVVPDVSFSFSGDSEKKRLRQEAATALEQLFQQAKEDEIVLHAVSGFRSFGTQQAIFQYNVNRQGEEEARRYSAYPGTSEHQTGLAMDVSSPSVNNALDDALGDTEEGKWLAKHAATYGFIIRYPQGKEAITGYAYEPWHLRYVGKHIAEQIYEQGLTLEEYFAADRPASSSR